MGADWNEVVGEWEILNNELHEDGTANAKIFCTKALPVRSGGEMYVSVDVVNPQAGDVFLIYPACPDAENVGDVIASFTFDGSSTWTISVEAGASSGSSEQTKTLTNNKARLWVCCDYTGAAVFAGVEGGISTDPDVGNAWADDAVFDAGRYVAIGHNNGGTSGATFDDFFIYELRVSSSRLCYTCGCDCDGIVPGKTLVGTVTAADDRAYCMQSEDFEMYWKWGSGTSYWQGDLTIPGTTPTTITYRLTCDNSDEANTPNNGSDTQINASLLGGYDAWDNPTYAEVDDDFYYAEASVTQDEFSQYLYLSNFGFAIPLNVDITGVEVQIQRQASPAGSVRDYGVYLHNGGSVIRGTNMAKEANWPEFEAGTTYGGQYETWGWGTLLDRDTVNSSSFGLIISAIGNSASAGTAQIDYVSMRIYYRYYPGYNFVLSITNGQCCVANAGGCSGLFRANAGSACNPLSLNFGPFYLSYSDLNCWICYEPMSGLTSGKYFITVTDV